MSYPEILTTVTAQSPVKMGPLKSVKFKAEKTLQIK